MLTTFKKILMVSRPVSWINTAFPFAAGYLVTGGSFDSLFWLATLYFLIPYNLLMYGINDIFDYESDIRNPRKGGIEGMKEQRSLHPVIAVSAIVSNVPFLIAMVFLGSVQSTLVLALVVASVVAYSVKYLRFKERPLLDSVTSSLHFVGPLVFALTLTDSLHLVVPYVLAFFLWGMASHAFGAVQDIIPDRQGNLASVATQFGAKNTMLLSFVLYAVAAGLLVIQSFPVWIVGVASLLYLVNIAPYLELTDRQSAQANAPWRRFIWINLFVGFVVTMVLLKDTFAAL